MSNPYYNSGSFPATGSPATSASMRAELALIAAGFEKLPTLSGNANLMVSVNETGTALVAGDDVLRLDLDVAGTTSAVGRLKWNDTDGTLDIGLKGGNVVLQVGQELVQMVRNNTGSTLLDMQVVYITGSIGSRVTVALAQANMEVSSTKVLGIVTEHISNGADGFVTTHGLVRDVDTSAFAEGAVLWLSAATAGGITTTRPSAPNHGVMLGYCVRSHATQGSIYVVVQNGYELDELHDVLISGLATNNMLRYNGTVWQNIAGPAGAVVGTTDSQTLTNKTLTSPTISSPTITGTISADSLTLAGNTTLGDAAGDTLTINAGTTTFTQGTANGVAYLNGSKVLTSGSALTFDGTNLGIGTSSPSYKLDVQSGTCVAQIRSSTTSAGSIPKLRFEHAGNDAFSIVGGSYMAFLSSDTTERMRLDSSGNLGIGTNSPGEKLSIAGRMKFSAFSTSVDDFALWADNANGLTLASASTWPMVFRTGNTERMRLSADGTLAISKTGTAYSAGLQLESSANLAGQLSPAINFSCANVNASIWSERLGSYGGNLVFATQGTSAGNPTERARLDASGNLGIGTSSPGSYGKLAVQNGVIAAVSADGTVQSVHSAANTGQVKLSSYNAGGTSYLTFGTGTDVERMRLDASGNLGLGLTPSAWYSDYRVAQIGLAGAVFNDNYNEDFNVSSNAYADTRGGYKFIRTGYAQRYRQTNSGQHQWLTSNASGTAGTAISFTQAMTLNSSGSLVVGSTTANRAGANTGISVEGALTSILEANINGSRSGFLYADAASTIVGEFRNLPLIFRTNDTERARIDSSGNLLLGTTSTGYQNNLSVTVQGPSGYVICNHVTGTSTGAVYAGFAYAGAGIGSITQNGTTAVAYNTSSDYRLKNITGPITNSGAYIDALNPVEGTWKADGSTFVGLIAHEVQEVSRTHIATGEKDGPEMQAMDYSSAEIIANLIAEVKSLRARVAALESA